MDPRRCLAAHGASHLPSRWCVRLCCMEKKEVKATSFMGPDDWKTGRDQIQHLNIYRSGLILYGP